MGELDDVVQHVMEKLKKEKALHSEWGLNGNLWPICTDGEPLRLGEDVEVFDEYRRGPCLALREVRVHGYGEFTFVGEEGKEVYFDAALQSVRRMRSDVLDCNGRPIRIGDLVETDAGSEPLEVVCVYGNEKPVTAWPLDGDDVVGRLLPKTFDGCELRVVGRADFQLANETWKVTGDALRDEFSEIGYSKVTAFDVHRLAYMVMRELGNGAASFSCEPMWLRKEMAINMGENGLVSAFLRVDGLGFNDYEGISFNRDGFVGFCGWASSRNAKPFYSAFHEWCGWMKEKDKDGTR